MNRAVSPPVAAAQPSLELREFDDVLVNRTKYAGHRAKSPGRVQMRASVRKGQR